MPSLIPLALIARLSLSSLRGPIRTILTRTVAFSFKLRVGQRVCAKNRSCAVLRALRMKCSRKFAVDSSRSGSSKETGPFRGGPEHASVDARDPWEEAERRAGCAFRRAGVTLQPLGFMVNRLQQSGFERSQFLQSVLIHAERVTHAFLADDRLGLAEADAPQLQRLGNH